MAAKKSETLELVLFCTLFMHLFCGLLLFIWSLHHRLDLATRIILTAELPIVITSFLVYGSSRLLAKNERDKEREERETLMQLEQSLQLIASLESQRHGFRNQLQVIQTLASLNKNDEIRQYVDECSASLDDLAGLARVEHTVLQALFLSLQGKIKEMGITFTLDCRADLSDFRCSPYRISRIFSNILQNAVESASLQRDTPTISVAIWNDDHGYRFVFWNNGPPIPTADLDRVFAPGFTQKAGHRGYGLHIVKTLTEELGGWVTVHSNETDGTEFHVWLPAAPTPH